MRALIALVLFCAMASLQAAEVAGVKIEEAMRVGGTELKLNGAGLRTRAFFKVYAMGLYLQDKQAATAAVLAAPGGQPSGKPIAGEDFYRALLRIWLGDNPVQGDLRKSLLGHGG